MEESGEEERRRLGAGGGGGGGAGGGGGGMRDKLKQDLNLALEKNKNYKCMQLIFSKSHFVSPM